MKSLFPSRRLPYVMMLAVVFFVLVSCNNNSGTASKSESMSADSTGSVMLDTTTAVMHDSVTVSIDTSLEVSRPGMSADSTGSVMHDSLTILRDSFSESTRLGRPKGDRGLARNPASVGLDSGFGETDAEKMEIDSSSKVEISKDSAIAAHNKIRKAVFGYSYFKNIKQTETRNINAYVSVINAVSKVIDTLKEINAQDIPERKNDTATIITKNILVFKALTVHLVNAGDSDFVIKSFAEPRQIIDSTNGNSWTWAVTPLTSKSHGRLIMNVVAEKPDGSREPFSTINIPIIITLNKEINRTIWQWMMDNPEKVITIILIPLIIFFWRQISGLFKKKDSGNKN